MSLSFGSIIKSFVSIVIMPVLGFMTVGLAYLSMSGWMFSKVQYIGGVQ